MAMLDSPATELGADYRWERVTPGEADYLPATHRLLHVLADRSRWQTALAEARRNAWQQGLGLREHGDLSAVRVAT